MDLFYMYIRWLYLCIAVCGQMGGCMGGWTGGWAGGWAGGLADACAMCMCACCGILYRGGAPGLQFPPSPHRSGPGDDVQQPHRPRLLPLPAPVAAAPLAQALKLLYSCCSHCER